MHPCGGSAQEYYSSTLYPSLADTHGFIVIYPSATADSNCFNANTAATLTHDGGSDSLAIANMVSYTITKYGAASSKVFATGSSSGAIMTNVLCGAYPDVFAAGVPFSGMPFGCLAGSPGSSPSSANPACADGQVQHTGAEWATIVHNAYPGYTGSYPRMQLWHGTADNVIYYQDLLEEIKEWSAVLGVSFTKNITNTPQSGYTEMVYGDGTKLVAYSAAGVGHYVPTHETQALAWFGLDQDTPGGGSVPTTTGTPTTMKTTTTASQTTSKSSTPPSGNCATEWGQCGGTGWTGATCCVSGSTCEFYSFQCLLLFC